MLSSLATAAGLRPKKKFHFDVNFLLEELLNCTYLTGVIFAKIRLRDGGAFSAISNSCDVKSHCVTWNQDFHFHSKMHGSPATGELEPCYCKVSIRKETKGGRSYKKLGYVKINLSEYAGAGATHKKYLLESYNESKHKPDNSILRVTITLKQTSGDSLFKVPRGAGDAEWELGGEGPADEGIQPDIIQTRLSYTSHASAVDNSLGTLNLGGVVTGTGGSLQDVRNALNGETTSTSRKTSSVSNLRIPSADLTPESITEESSKSGATPAESSESTPRVLSPRPLVVLKTSRSSSFNNGPESHNSLPPSGLTHRRMDSWSQAGTSHTPPQTKHNRQHSLVSGQSSKSTSAYSTLSEKSGGSVEGGDVDSASLRGRLTLLATSSRMEQSRVNPQAVIDNMFSGHTFDSKETETETGGGLQIYVDKNLGTVTLAGPNLDRKNTHLQAIDVNEHKSVSPKRHRKKSLHIGNKDVSHSGSRETSIHEHSPSPPPSSSSSTGAVVPPLPTSSAAGSSSTSSSTASTITLTANSAITST